MLKTTRTALCPASCGQCFKTKAWGGRGAGTPAPQLPLLRQNLVRANFAEPLKEMLVKERKIKSSPSLLLFCFALTLNKSKTHACVWIYLGRSMRFQ